MATSTTASDAPWRIRRALRLSVLDGVLHAAMVGASESYLAALAVELGHGPTSLALLMTVPLLAGALSQLFTVPLAEALGSRKALVVASASLQALAHLAFFAIAATGTRALAPLLLAQVVFWVGGAAGVPAWNAWMATLTQRVRRERYFALRSGAVSLALVVAFAAGGTILFYAQRGGAALAAFRWLFAAALVARLGSAAALFFQHDPGAPSPLASGAPLAPVRERFRLALTTSEWSVAGYVAVLMLGAQVAIPFFTPFMLRELGLDYGEYAALTAVSLLAKAATFPACHRAAHALGLRTLLALSGAGVAAIPVVWALHPTMALLVVAQVWSGMAWAGMEYASFQLLLSSARPECRMEFLSLAAALSGSAQLVGAVAGGILLAQGGLPYASVFLMSAVARGLALALLVPAVRRVRGPAHLPALFMRLQGVRTSGGAVRNPIVTDAPLPPRSAEDSIPPPPAPEPPTASVGR